MSYFVISYDIRSRNKDDYPRLYEQLEKWHATHLQNSVWLATLNLTASQIRNAINDHITSGDTICVIELGEVDVDWSSQNVRSEGVAWLKKVSP